MSSQDLAPETATDAAAGEADAPALKKINDLLRRAVEQGASDLHLKGGAIPHIRVAGHLQRMKSMTAELTKEQTLEMAFALMSIRQKTRFLEMFEVDIAHSVSGLGRFRANIFLDRKGMGAVFRTIPTKILTAEEAKSYGIVDEVIQSRKLNALPG